MTRNTTRARCIMTTEDARRALELGADGIVVSNDGARQLDGAVSSMEIRYRGWRGCVIAASDVAAGGEAGATHARLGRALGTVAAQPQWLLEPTGPSEKTRSWSVT